MRINYEQLYERADECVQDYDDEKEAKSMQRWLSLHDQRHVYSEWRRWAQHQEYNRLIEIAQEV